MEVFALGNTDSSVAVRFPFNFEVMLYTCVHVCWSVLDSDFCHEIMFIVTATALLLLLLLLVVQSV